MNTLKKIWLFITTTVTLGIITVYAAQIITTTSQTAVSGDKISADWVNAINNFVTNPTGPTPNADDDSTKMATTEWVQNKVVSASTSETCTLISLTNSCQTYLENNGFPSIIYYGTNFNGNYYIGFKNISSITCGTSSISFTYGYNQTNQELSTNSTYVRLCK